MKPYKLVSGDSLTIASIADTATPSLVWINPGQSNATEFIEKLGVKYSIKRCLF